MPKPVDDWVIRPPQGATAGPVDDWEVTANPVTAVGLGDLVKEAVPFNYGAKAAARIRQVKGDDYEKALEDERRKTEAFRKAHPGYAIAANLAGGAVPGLGLLGKLGQGASALGTIGRSATLGAGIGGISGYNEDDSLDSAVMGTAIGTGLGAGLPAVVSGAGWVGNKVATNPRYVRFKEDLAASKAGQLWADERGSIQLPGAGGTPAAAPPPGGVIPPSPLDSMSPGAKAAAYQTIANYLASGGKSVDELRASLQRAVESGRFHSTGRAQDVLALIDLDPSLASLAGSAMRKSDEVKRQGTAFLKARQKGITPEEGLPLSAGLPTREAMSERITGEQSKKLYGTDYGAGNPNIVPMGQGERIGDMLKRSMNIKDSDYHGHGANAYRTDQAILAKAKEEATPAYNLLYETGNNHNISGQVQPVLDKWLGMLEDPSSRIPKPIRDSMAKEIRMLFAPDGRTVTHIEGFDLAKRVLDDRIDNLLSKMGSNVDKVSAKLYTDLKDELLHGIKDRAGKVVGGMDNHPVLGKLYADTRAKWSSDMESREMLQLGRELFSAEANLAADAIDAIPSDEKMKLVRLGYVGAYEDKSKAAKRAVDRTQWFDNERQEEILSKLIPRTDGVFSDRPERAGRYLANEKRMVDSNYEVTGNSKTVERQAADMKFDQVSRVSQAIETWKNSGSLSNIGLRVAQNIIEKYFGMPADAARALGQMMFTADKERLAVVLSEVQKRMGKDRFEHFSRLMQQAQAAVSPGATTGLIGGSAGQAAQSLP